MAATVPGENLEQTVFEILRETQEVLKESKERFGSGENPHAEALEEEIAELGIDSLAFLLKTGRGTVALRSNANSWRDESLALELSRLAQARYIDAQNQEVLRLLGGKHITATRLDGFSADAGDTTIARGIEAVDGPITGTIGPVSVRHGLITLVRPEVRPDATSGYQIWPLEADGSPKVSLDIQNPPANLGDVDFSPVQPAP